MKYIIGAVLGLMLGGGIEFEIGHYQTRVALMQIGNSYGCGALAGMKDTIKKLDSSANLLPEAPWCADYRKLWEAK